MPVERTDLCDKSMEIIEQVENVKNIKQATMALAELKQLLEGERAKLNESAEQKKKGQAALKTLKKGDITELKSLGNPPQLVIESIGALMALLQKPEDWSTAKKEIGNSQFVEKL